MSPGAATAALSTTRKTRGYTMNTITRLLTIACLAWYRLADQRRRQRADYSRPSHSGRFVALAAALGVVVGLVHAYQVAWWYLA